MSRASGSDLGRDADEGDLLEVVLVGEVGERRVARHDLATLRAPEPGEVRRALEPLRERVRRLRAAEGGGDRPGDPPAPYRSSQTRVGLRAIAGEQLDLPEDVERSPVRLWTASSTADWNRRPRRR